MQIARTQSAIRRILTQGSLLLFFLMLACTQNPDGVTPVISDNDIRSTADVLGQQFYNHISNHALEDPTLQLSPEEQASYKSAFDKLKAGRIDSKATWAQQVSEKQITKAVYDAVTQFDDALIQFVQQNADAVACAKWSTTQEDATMKRIDLTPGEKQRILSHQILLRNYIQYTMETLPTDQAGATSRTEGLNSILCYIGCAVNNISSFSAVGALAGGYGELIGAGVGLIYTIVNPGSCSCGSGQACAAATSISTPDVCYNATTGKQFTAWGYGSLPGQFEWDFYRETITTLGFADFVTGSDSYTLSNTNLAGASKLAVRVISNCTGTLLYSNYIWFAPADTGKPRPAIIVTEMGNNLAKYDVVGPNNNTYSWGYIMPYRGTITAGGGTTSSITIQWVNSGLRIGVQAFTASACGTGTAVAH